MVPISCMNFKILMTPAINYSRIFIYISMASIGLFFVSAFLLPLLVCRIPDDYFLFHDSKSSVKVFSLSRLLRVLARNVAGYVMVSAGLIMLFIPGQGLLTILLGVIFIDFPGKNVLERRVIRIRRLQMALNWIRRKNNVNELKFP